MPCRKTACGPVSRLVIKRGAARAPISLGTCEKKRSSTTLLSSETSHNYFLPLKDIPGPPSIPLLGTAYQYFPGGRYSLANLHEASIDKFRRYGPVVLEEFQWRRPVVHLYNPEDFETVFRYQGPQPLRPISEFVKHYRLKNPEKYDTPGLANSVGEEWQRLRKVLAPVLLQLNSLDGLIGDMNNICDDFVNLVRCERNQNTHIINNLQEIVYRLSLEAIYMMSLESRLGCLEAKLLPETSAFAMISSVKLLFEAFQELYYGLPIWRFFKTSAYRKLDKAESTMYDATNSRIQEAIERLRKDNVSKNEGKPSVLETLLRTKDLTDKEIRVTVIDFISGGIFTVTNAFSFLVYHLSRNSSVQDKLYSELLEVAPDSVITSERLTKLPYLKACVKESFRLTPTIPCITRVLPEDIIASGLYHIPAGTPLFCNFMVACKEADKFPNPEQFQPERWLHKTQAARNVNPFTLLPFGFGYRMCVGRRFAEMEMYTALAKLICNFKLINTGQEIKCKQAFILVPSHPVSVGFKDR